MPTTPGPYQPVSQALREVGKQDDPQISELAAGLYRVCGTIDFIGAGELTEAVDFPVQFTEKPSFVCGGELRPNSPMISGSLPTVSGIVGNWKQSRDSQHGYPTFTGCTFLIVATGHPDQLLTFHYQLEGAGDRKSVTSTGPSLLGDFRPAGTPPTPGSGGSGIGIRYTGEADLIPEQINFKIDGQSLNPAPPPAGSLFLYHEDTGLSAPPYHGPGLVIYAILPMNMRDGIHNFSVLVTDVNGHQDKVIWQVPILTARSGPS